MTMQWTTRVGRPVPATDEKADEEPSLFDAKELATRTRKNLEGNARSSKT